MRRDSQDRSFRRWALSATAFAIAYPASSQACRTYVQPTLSDVRFADVVVVGRVTDYRIVRNEAARRQKLALPGISPEMRRTLANPNQKLLFDYARFKVQVEEVIVGSAPRTLSVTWDNSTFDEPDQLASGPYLIALRRPASSGSPLRGPSGRMLPSPEGQTLTLLQAPCSSAFIYEVASEKGRAVRRILNAHSR
jgi:hypothetical protein